MSSDRAWCGAWCGAGIGVACVCAGMAMAEPDPSRVFDVAGGRATSIVVTGSIELPAEVELGSPMLRALAGVLGVMDGREWTRLRAMVRSAEAPASLDGAELVGVMHISGASSNKRVEILRLAGGEVVASEVDPLDAGGVAAAAVLPVEFGEVVSGWSPYRGGFGAVGEDTPRGRSVDMEHPYTPGRVTFDQETMGDRFLNGRETDLRGAARDLEAETLWVRLPAGYDPRTPAGAIVWIDPTDSGRPPEFMHAAADELNLIIVGASAAGNDRYISDRHQLMFDALATAQVRYHVDESRVYAAGVSGGGRVACMYWACFPEVFAGAVAIVGTSCYENVPMGNGAYMPRGFTLPSGARADLRGHRLAAVTGPRDFNAMEIRQTVNIFDHDGFEAELFEFEGMGHEYPTPERFGRVMRWVDEPWRDARAEDEARATVMLAGVKERVSARAGEGGVGVAVELTGAEREALVRVTETAPWSGSAWEAAVLLGVASAADAEGSAGGG